MLEEILAFTAQCGASDVHIVTGMPPAYRIDGEIIPLPDIAGAESLLAKYPLLANPLDSKKSNALVINLLKCADIKCEELNTCKNVDFAHQGKNGQRFRVNVYFERGNLSAACRALPSEIPVIGDLFSAIPYAENTLIKLASLPHGLVLVTGPTGSGKSTTLAAMINYINKNFRKCIITIEDPVEYVHYHDKSIIGQREIGRDVLTFSDGLRAALREDPDVILVGEMRDMETIETALHAAKTGHLVLSTLHTSKASDTVERIIGMFAGEKQPTIRSDLADVLQGVIAQQLLRKKNGGRVPAVEILVVTPAVRALIREGKAHQISTAIQTGKDDGMVLMEKSLSELIRSGLVNEETAEDKTLNKKLLAEYAIGR